jgi:hypothetical protein
MLRFCAACSATAHSRMLLNPVHASSVDIPGGVIAARRVLGSADGDVAALEEVPDLASGPVAVVDVVEESSADGAPADGSLDDGGIVADCSAGCAPAEVCAAAD